MSTRREVIKNEKRRRKARQKLVTYIINRFGHPGRGCPHLDHHRLPAAQSRLPAKMHRP